MRNGSTKLENPSRMWEGGGGRMRALLSVFLITAASLRKASDAEMCKSGWGSRLNSEQMWEALESVPISSSPPPPLLSHTDWRLLASVSAGSFVDFTGKRFSCVLCFMFSDVSVFRSQLRDVPSLDDRHGERRRVRVRTPGQQSGEQRLGGEHNRTAGQNHPYWSSEYVTLSLPTSAFFLPDTAFRWVLNGF